MASIPDGLFEKMVQEFDARGCYAVEMLKTADWLLGPTAHAPRRSSAAAYCIRQAVIELFQSKADPKYTRYAVSKEIVGAKRRFRNSNHPADTELQKLLDAVGKLEEILNANTEHQNRLAATIKRRTGRDPWSGENSPMKVYRQEISRLNTLAHDVAPKVESTDAVRECLERILDMLAWILLPTKRQAEIINLAEMPEPHGPDARHLREVMVSANDFDLFASKVQSPAWFQIIDRSMLKPPLDNSPWLAGYLVRHLKPAHLDAFVSLIQKNWGDWTRCDVSHGEFAWLLHRLGDRGTPFLINLLRRDPTSKTACFYASRACSDMQASNPSVAILADLLLTPDSGLGYYDRAVRVPAKLVEGMTDLPSSEERIEILTFKLRNQLRRRGSFRMKGYASVANLDYDASYPANSLLAHLRDALKKGKELGNSTSRMVAWLAPLPDDVRSRLVAWLYSIADDADCLDMADFVASGISGRLPTGDDVALLDRLGRDCNTDAVATRLAGIIGEAPKLDNLKNIMRGGHGTEDARRITWAVAMKNDIKHTEWKETLDALAELGIGGDSVRERPVHVSIGPTSPFGAEQFADADPYDLAAKITSWRPGTKNGPNPPSALGIRRILKDSAKRDPGKWAKDPVRMINLLRHPTYVAGYFLGMSHADGSLDSYADRLVRAVCFAHTHPWQAVPLDPSPFEYDADWQNADMAGIDLIRTLVERNAPIGDESMSDAWKLVRESASGESAEPDTHAGDLSVQSSSEDGVLDVVSPRMSALDT